MPHADLRKMIGAASALLLGTLWIGRIAAQAPAHDSGGAGISVKTIDNPDGGRISSARWRDSTHPRMRWEDSA